MCQFWWALDGTTFASAYSISCSIYFCQESWYNRRMIVLKHFTLMRSSAPVNFFHHKNYMYCTCDYIATVVNVDVHWFCIRWINFHRHVHVGADAEWFWGQHLCYLICKEAFIVCAGCSNYMVKGCVSSFPVVRCGCQCDPECDINLDKTTWLNGRSRG